MLVLWAFALVCFADCPIPTPHPTIATTTTPHHHHYHHHHHTTQEKLNVWLALLNLEHAFGDARSLDATFATAAAESNGKLLHLRLSETLERAGDAEGARRLLDRALKKYKYSKKVWMQLQQLELRRGAHSEAKALLARSLQSLGRHKHVEVITQFACAEFDSAAADSAGEGAGAGSQDRGRVVFEELLAAYPKRTDLWHVYVDKEIKAGNTAQARQLLERMLGLRLNLKNVKAVFKKYLNFEQRFGDERSVAEVKDKARSYASSMA